MFTGWLEILKPTINPLIHEQLNPLLAPGLSGLPLNRLPFQNSGRLPLLKLLPSASASQQVSSLGITIQPAQGL